MADGSNKHLDLDHESFQGPAWSEQPYTEVEHNMLKQARKAVPTAHKQLIPFKKSAEPDDTHKVSSVATKTKNRYGV
jgi:glucose-6-phosphate isomerase